MDVLEMKEDWSSLATSLEAELEPMVALMSDKGTMSRGMGF